MQITPQFVLPQNVTSLPQTRSPCNLAIFSTTIKELRQDPLECQHVQQNLIEIAKQGEEIISLKSLAGIEEEVDLQTIRSLEQLARGYAYHAVHGSQISLHVNGKMITYAVEEIPLWKGIVAYGLKPLNKEDPPILLFRGSSFYPSGRGSFATMIADIDPFSPGALVYKCFSKKIKHWLAEVNTSHSAKPYVTGHSLGGAFAAYTAIEYSASVQPFTYTHATVGLSCLAKKKVKKMQDAAPKILNFFYEKDPLTKWGHHRIGTDIQVSCDLDACAPAQEKIKWRQKSLSHRISLLDKPSTLLHKTAPSMLPVWAYIPLFTIPFVGGLVGLTLSKFLIGTYTSKPYHSLFGPVRWTWHKIYQHSLKTNP